MSFFMFRGYFGHFRGFMSILVFLVVFGILELGDL